MPTTLFNSAKRVFAHYFPPFPASIDNKPSASDYYNAQYLSKTGESSKWIKQGGYLRQRPLGVPTSTSANWQLVNMEGEVRAAIARGITGFTLDVMNAGDPSNASSALNLMLAAAQAVDPRFKIIVMPDISVLSTNAAAVEAIIEKAASSPAAYRLSDGRLVVSAFEAELNAAGWWQSVIDQVASRGIQIAFMPTFVTWPKTTSAWVPFSYGFSAWGTATVAGAGAVETLVGSIQSTYKKVFMSPADPQQYRPKSYVYWESANSAAFRESWMSTLSADPEMVQLVTWNDYSESSVVSPYTDATLQRNIGTGFYNLTGYYASWFLTGQQPVITHDVLYYFYRKEATTAAAPAQSQKANVATGAAENDIELLAFLTSPAVLKITIGGTTHTQNAAAGIVSFKVPSAAGTPVFTLTRSGTDVFSFQGGVQISGAGGLPSGVQDLTYWTGSAAKSGVCAL